MSERWDPASTIRCSKAVKWLLETGIFRGMSRQRLMSTSRGDLAANFAQGGCRLPSPMSLCDQTATYIRLKKMLAGREAPHEPAMLHYCAKVLGGQPATKASVERILGATSVEQVDAILGIQGFPTPKRARPRREAELEELLACFPAESSTSLTEAFAKAARRGTPVSRLHIGRVMGLCDALRGFGTLLLLSCSWKKQAPATSMA